MNNYFENLKTKPIHHKKRFAFLVSFSFSFLILAGWLASYGVSSSTVIADSTDSNGNVVTSSIDAPVSSLTATAIGAWTDIKNLFWGSNKTEYSKDEIQVKAGDR